MSFEHISFEIQIGRLLAEEGLLLGEIQSKLEHVLTTPLHPDIAEKLSQTYFAKGINATTAIEGNTLSEEDVALILAKQKSLPPSKEYLQNEVQNIEQLLRQAQEDVLLGNTPKALSIEAFCFFQNKILSNLPVEPGVKLGTFRNTVVRVGPYKCPDWQDCPELMDRFIAFYNHELPERLSALKTPFVAALIRAVLAHLYIVWIHPFGDGNGRTARFIESQTLMNAGVPFISCQLLSNFYNATRSEYVRHLSLTWQRPHDGVYDFFRYALGGLRDELKEQILVIQGHVWDVVLENTIHKEFGTHKSDADKRKRDLALFFFNNKTSYYTLEDLTEHPIIFKLYGNKRTQRTLQSDLKALMDFRLVIDINKLFGIQSKTVKYGMNRLHVFRQLPDHKLNSENKILRQYFSAILPESPQVQKKPQ